VKRKGRYGNVQKIEYAGIKFDSRREYDRYMDLRLMEMAGEVKDIEVHPRFPIVIAGIPIKMRSARYPNGRTLTYVADFRYLDVKSEETIIEDVKMQSGHRTDVYRIKRALMEAMGYRIKEY